MRRLMVIAFVLVPMLAPAVGWADQAALISKQDAQAAAARIRLGDEVREYCKPCGDTSYTPIKVAKVEVASVGDYYEVRLNGRGVDLAYEYVRNADKWENLAMLVGLPVKDVPRSLPDDRPRKK